LHCALEPNAARWLPDPNPFHGTDDITFAALALPDQTEIEA
jgi:hypothetical protein